MTVDDISVGLFAKQPHDVLYHYTSFSGLNGIISRRAIWASDIRYLNDMAELGHIKSVLDPLIAQRLEHRNSDPELLHELRDWLALNVILAPLRNFETKLLPTALRIKPQSLWRRQQV